MVRQLPDDPVKKRRQIFKRIYQHQEHWEALREDRGMDDVITTPDGEDIYLGDLLVGLPYLPRQQRRAFERICMKGYTEGAARDEMLPNSESSTPVQQYADGGLIRMIEFYDMKQRGDWPPPPPKRSRRSFMTALHPLVRQGLEDTLKKIQIQQDGLRIAASQVEDMLKADKGASSSKSAPAPAEISASTDAPADKPNLREMAKSLAQDDDDEQQVAS